LNGEYKSKTIIEGDQYPTTVTLWTRKTYKGQ